MTGSDCRLVGEDDWGEEGFKMTCGVILFFVKYILLIYNICRVNYMFGPCDFNKRNKKYN